MCRLKVTVETCIEILFKFKITNKCNTHHEENFRHETIRSNDGRQAHFHLPFIGFPWLQRVWIRCRAIFFWIAIKVLRRRGRAIYFFKHILNIGLQNPRNVFSKITYLIKIQLVIFTRTTYEMSNCYIQLLLCIIIIYNNKYNLYYCYVKTMRRLLHSFIGDQTRMLCRTRKS